VQSRAKSAVLYLVEFEGVLMQVAIIIIYIIFWKV
jgi:hypothetical protein